jgi:hypothetical protein
MGAHTSTLISGQIPLVDADLGRGTGADPTAARALVAPASHLRRPLESGLGRGVRWIRTVSATTTNSKPLDETGPTLSHSGGFAFGTLGRGGEWVWSRSS